MDNIDKEQFKNLFKELLEDSSVSINLEKSYSYRTTIKELVIKIDKRIVYKKVLEKV